MLRTLTRQSGAAITRGVIAWLDAACQPTRASPMTPCAGGHTGGTVADVVRERTQSLGLATQYFGDEPFSCFAVSRLYPRPLASMELSGRRPLRLKPDVRRLRAGRVEPEAQPVERNAIVIGQVRGVAHKEGRRVWHLATVNAATAAFWRISLTPRDS